MHDALTHPNNQSQPDPHTPTALPENTGLSSGPVQCMTPLTAVNTGTGAGLTPSVARSAFASTPGIVADRRYDPVSGFRSMSPVMRSGTAPK